MRVRPVFWCILALSCLGVLVFASTVRTHTPAIMQVRLDSTTAIASGYTTVELHLSDPQGLPIEQAQVTPNAHMKNMDMMAYAILVQAQGQGNYRILVQLYMAGPWEIDIAAHADGFDTPQRTILVQVQ